MEISYMNKIFTTLFVLTSLTFLACKNETKKEQKDTTPKDSLSNPKVEEAPKVEPQKFTYTAWPIKTSDSLKKALKDFTPEELRIIEVLNRADAKHLSRIDTILIPNEFKEVLDYSIFPQQVTLIQEVPKFVIFSYPAQAYAVYESGKLIKWGPTNMGKKATPTPKGIFFANWKGKEIKSSVNSSWILKWNFNVHNALGVGWHQYELPGYPASHSCMRLLADDAKWLYDWADQWKLKNGQLMAKGTPTVIFGDYPWGERRPWKALLENPQALQLSEADLDKIINPYMEKIKLAQQERTAYLNSLATDTTSTL